MKHNWVQLNQKVKSNNYWIIIPKVKKVWEISGICNIQKIWTLIRVCIPNPLKLWISLLLIKIQSYNLSKIPKNLINYHNNIQMIFQIKERIRIFSGQIF